MKNEELEAAPLHRRRETMADGERYIIYYTFGGNDEQKPDEERENV